MYVTTDEARSAMASHADDVEVVGERRRDDRFAAYDVRLDGERAVCKFSPGDGSGPLHPPALEAAVCRAVRSTEAVRAPSVAHVGDGYVLLEALPGDRYDPDAPPAARDRRIRAVGAALARLHCATAGWFEGCGRLTVADDAATPRTALSVADPVPWGERFAAVLEDWLAPLADAGQADLARAVRTAVDRARERGLFDGLDPALVHGWPKLLDVRFGDGAGGAPDLDPAVGLTDWSAAAAAPPEFDLAHARLDSFDLPYAGEDEGFRDALLAGYRSVRTPARKSADRRRLYRAGLTAQYLPQLVEGAASGGIDRDPERFERRLRAYAVDCLATVECLDAGEGLAGVENPDPGGIPSLESGGEGR